MQRLRDKLEELKDYDPIHDVSQCQRGTAPVVSRQVQLVVKATGAEDFMRSGDGNVRLRLDFLETYLDWLQASSQSVALGLTEYPHQYFTNGVTEGYDIFMRSFAGSRFRVLKGEYPYTALSEPSWEYIEDDELRTDDAVVLSSPFYATGRPPQDYDRILDRCKDLHIPVFVDAAYFGTCYGESFDYSHPAITMVGFSLSKTFAIQSYRCGMLLTRKKLRHLEEIQVSANYFNRVGAYMGMRLMRVFPADFMPGKYRRRHQLVCYRLGLLPTSSIMLANVREGDHRFDDLLADGRFDPYTRPSHLLPRVSVSAYVSDAPPVVKRVVKWALQR